MQESENLISGFSSYIIMKIVVDEMIGIKVGCLGEKCKGKVGYRLPAVPSLRLPMPS